MSDLHDPTVPADYCPCDDCIRLVQLRADYVQNKPRIKQNKYPGKASMWVRGENVVVDRPMNVAEYEHYRSTSAWKAIRATVRERDGFACRVCRATDSIVVHHKTYEHQGAEHPDELVVLCARCHAHFHDDEFGAGRGRAMSKQDFAKQAGRARRGWRDG